MKNKKETKTNIWRKYVFWTNPFVWTLRILGAILSLIIAPIMFMTKLEEEQDKEE